MSSCPKPFLLVDLSVLSHLEDQLEDPAPAQAFAHDYIVMWEERYVRLNDTVSRGDLAAALDAVLSVIAASMMIGATRLVAVIGLLKSALVKADPIQARRILPDIERCGLETMRELKLTYLLPAV